MSAVDLPLRRSPGVPPVRALARRAAVRGVGVWFPLAVFGLTRLWAVLAVLAQAGSRRGVTPDPLAGDSLPTYASVIANWDGQWYERIATRGYPTPGAGMGADQAHAWAFPPGYPVLVGLVARTGLDLAWAVTLVDLLAGAAAVVVLFDLLRRCGGVGLATTGTALVCCFVTAPLLQAVYSESLALLLLSSVLWSLVTRRYALAAVAVLALSLTRVVTPPLALVVAAHLLARVRTRRQDPLRRREVAGLVGLALLSLLGAVTWAGLARLLGAGATGATARPGEVAVSLGWFGESAHALGPAGPVLVAVLLLLLVLAARHPGTRAWGPELRTWLWAYPAFLLAVTPITSGILRYLLLCLPLGLAGVAVLAPPVAAALRSCGVPRAERVAPVGVTLALCALGLAAQWWWTGVSLVAVHGLMA